MVINIFNEGVCIHEFLTYCDPLRMWKGRKLGGRKAEGLEDENEASMAISKDQSSNLKPNLNNDINHFIYKEVETKTKPNNTNSSAAKLTNVEEEMGTTYLSDKPNLQDTLDALVTLKVKVAEAEPTELNTCTSYIFTWGAEGRLCKFKDTGYGDNTSLEQV